MRNITRASVALVAAVALTGVTVTSASAAEGITTTTASVAAGVLTITVPGAVALTSTGPGEPAIGEIAVSVNDATASNAGWETTISVSDFGTTAGGGTTIPATSFTYTAPDADTTQSAVPPTVTSAGAVVPTAADTEMPVQTATGAAGNNIATWTAGLSLTIPATAVAGAYAAELTHSVLP